MAKEKKEKPEKEPVNRPEKYEKSDLAIKGTFDEAMNVFFRKLKTKEKDK